MNSSSVKIVLAQLNYVVGDIEGNCKKILDAYKQAKDESVLLICSELAITGYYPQDLVSKESVLNRQVEALKLLADATKGNNAGIVVGYLARNRQPTGKGLFNALALFSNGEQVFEYHKRLLPTYNIFDEARHFSPGSNQGVFEWNGQRLGFLICEDAWADSDSLKYAQDPVVDLKHHPLDLVISINASPNNLGKMQQRIEVIKKVVDETKAPVAYLNQVGGNDELVFDGASFVMNTDGEVVYQLKSFEEDVAEIDVEKVEQTTVPNYMTDGEIVLKQTVLGIRDYVQKCGFSKVVIGSSGGIDSAVTLAICAEALGGENVVAITMPSKYSSKGSVGDSVILCKNLGVELLNASIAEEFELAVKRFELMSGEKPSGLTQENMQARIRGRILMEYSNHFGALVISTGNKSEMSVGYATLYGDMNGGINPLGDLYKMEVYALAKLFNKKAAKELIPRVIIEKEPSAELSEDQFDSDSLPEYPLLDAILKLYIEGDLLECEQARQCQEVIERFAATEQDIQRIHRLVDKAEFKRRQAPPIIRVQKRSFGMGRWLPVAAKY
jgi:NAD+ synthetase